MKTELIIKNAHIGLSVFQYITYIWVTGMAILFGIFMNKIILQIFDYLTKQKKQIELNSAVINSLIENNDNKNLKFEETVNALHLFSFKTPILYEKL